MIASYEPCECYDDQHPSDLMVCEACEHTWRSIDDVMRCVHYCIACPECEGMETGPRWAEADKCKNCGTLTHDLPVSFVFCSRRCQLQAEYAESLKAGAAS